jgi:hypothetical protein
MLPGAVDVVEHRKQRGEHREGGVLLDQLAVPVHPALVVDVLGLEPLEVAGQGRDVLLGLG